MMNKVRFERLLCASCLAYSLWSCSADQRKRPPALTQASASSTTAPPAPGDRPEPYPQGSWRAAPPTELDRTVLWLSHLVIRHVDVDGSRTPFNLTGWQSGALPATRSRLEAFQLAERLARQAQEQGNFAELARQYSEDATTNQRGGSLGGVVAGHLSAWPGVLDAVATLKPGEVSRVVETEYGYHLLYRRPAAPEAVVSGSHIVIAHIDAPWIALAARGALPNRSREDALALAHRLCEQARRAPGDFAKLVNEYSEHRDAARGGDFGSWSTREASGYPREIETLAQLDVGEVAEPLDTVFGYQVILRTPNRPRASYAMTKIQLRFDASRPEVDPYSKPSIHAKAQQLARLLRQRPQNSRNIRRKGAAVRCSG